jgi:amino acid adenylation domain-containing protein
VQKTPDAVAVVFEEKQLTYGELNGKANQLAHYLRGKGVKEESLVPICLERSLEMIIGILGILKAGGAYVPIDPAYPEERIIYMLEDTNAHLVVTSSESKLNLPATEESMVIDLDSDWANISKESIVNPNLYPASHHLAYVIYTSGSTGKPKGVLIEHKGLAASTHARQSYYKDQGSVLLIPSFAFDSSVAVIFGSLVTGGKLILCRSELIKDPHHIKGLLKETNTILCVPSYYRFLLEEELLVAPGLSNVILAGEKLDEKLVNLHYNETDHVPLFNEYGPTECTVWATVAEIHSINEKVTIGKPINNTSIYIVGKDGELKPIGVAGELCIGGEGVGRGYLNRPELTEEKFTVNPFSQETGARMYRTGDLARWLADGNIEYLGRLDDQVKIRGYRIELGEIEATLNGLANVKESVVIVREDVPGDKRLTGYVVCEEPLLSLPEQRRPALLRKELRTLLPEYMVPGDWVFLDSLPLTANNKIDRKTLPRPLDSIALNPEPTTTRENLISRIWCKSLNKEAIDIQTDFFEIGGHSLLAVKVMSALEKETGIKLPLNVIFKYPSISELAKYLDDSNLNEVTWNSLVPIKPNGVKPPLYIVHGVGSTVSIYYRLANLMENAQPVYGFQPKGLNGKDVPNKSVEEMAAYYISLIVHQNPKGPYCLAGYSFGGYVAYEMAQQLKVMGKKVDSLILFDTAAYEEKDNLSSYKKVKLELGKRITDLIFLFKEPKGFFDLKKRSFTRKKDKTLVLLKIKPSPDSLDDHNSNIKRAAKNNVRILNKYDLSPYHGDIYLFKAKNRSFYVEDPSNYGWLPFVNQVRVINVSGHHDNIFIDPKILEEMAEKIQKVLDKKLDS